MSRKFGVKPPSSFLRFNSSPEVIRLVVMMYVRFPLSLRNVEDLLFERGIEICHETLPKAYGAGLRVSEVADLKTDDIDSKRMLIRIEEGKGRSFLLLHGWLFPGRS